MRQSRLAAFTIVLLTLSSFGQIPQTGAEPTGGGPPGGDVEALVIDPLNREVLYAGTEDGGIFKSTNRGGTWFPSNFGNPNKWITALVIDPSNTSTIYAGTNRGVFKSTNSATSWNEVGRDAIGGGLVYRLLIPPDNPSSIYVSSSGGLYRSDDGGTSWEKINSVQPQTWIGALAFDPGNPEVIYADVNRSDHVLVYDSWKESGIYKSSDVVGSGRSSVPCRQTSW